MADPLDILYGRPSRGSENDIAPTLANIASVIASIPEHRARAAQQRAQLERTQLEAYNEQLKAQEMQRKVSDLQAIDQAWQSGDEEKFLSLVPGHLQIQTRKGLAELREADAKRKKALEDARKASDDTVARTLQFVAGVGYDPGMAQGAISELKRMYQDDPQHQQMFGLIEKAIHENPTPEHVKMITDALIAKSTEQRKANEEAAAAKSKLALEQQKLTGTEPIQPEAQARIDAQKEQAAATLAETHAAHEETARNNAVQNRIAALNAESNRMRALKAGQGGASKPRGVTSGDANRLAEMQTGLKDLDQLSGKVGSTGTASRIGAALWNPITEFTGIGAESKATQAVIDTIKQIIGKSLEGGVLRKEDEIKYEKILPRIGDPPEVAKSKIESLKQTIGQKRQDLLSSLDDAGYDVSRYGSSQKRIKVTFDKDGNLVRQ